MCIHTRALSTRRKDICHPDFAFHFSREVAMLATHFAERMLLMASPVVLGARLYIRTRLRRRAGTVEVGKHFLLVSFPSAIFQYTELSDPFKFDTDPRTLD